MTSVWSHYVLTRQFLSLVILALLSVALFAAAAGYRRWALGFCVCLAASGIAGVITGFLCLAVALLIGGRGEGSGVAALLAGVLVGSVGAGIALIGSVVWLVWKRERFNTKSSPSWPLLALGLACMVMAAMSLRPLFPGARSAANLTRQLASGLDASYERAAEKELVRRGQESVSAIIAALHRVPDEQVREIESGLNTGVKDQLMTLGRIGGPEAISELRAWLARDAAPDVRAAAARGLSEADDQESAHAIGVLLENRDYDWRKLHTELILALGQLRAAGEVAHIRSALTVEAGSSFDIMLLNAGIGCLAKIGTPEAKSVIDELASNGDPNRCKLVRSILAELDAAGQQQSRSFPREAQVTGQTGN